MGDDHHRALVVADLEVAAPLTPHQQPTAVAEVDHVVDQDAERLGNAQSHHPLEPQHQLVDRV